MYSWFDVLNKPFLSPPAIVFQIVWPILYFLMLLSLIFFLRGKFSVNKIFPLLAFGLQLILNLAWSPVFFVMRDMKFALVIVLFMILFTVITIFMFRKYSKISANLLIPYLIWIIFAAYLNFEFIRLN